MSAEPLGVGMPASRGRLQGLLSRHALDHLGQAQAAVTIAFGGTMLGIAARTVATISHEPPRVLVALEAGPRVVDAIESLGSFGLNLIDEESRFLAGRFLPGREVVLDGLTVIRSAAGHPLLGDSMAQLDCAVHDVQTLGGLRVFLADVTDARARAGASLEAIGDQLRSFVASRDDATYQEMRHAILERRFPLEHDILVQDVVTQLDVERPNVTYALARLTHEGLVTRRTSERYAVTPVDEQLILTLLHARRILMMGITDCLIAELTAAEVQSVVDAAEATRRLPGTNDVGMENDDSVRVFRSFNETVVGLSGNSVLLDTYRRLSVPTVMGRVLWRLDWSTLHDELSLHAVAFAAALSSRDRDAAIEAIRAFNDSVHDYAVGVLRSTGGRL